MKRTREEAAVVIQEAHERDESMRQCHCDTVHSTHALLPNPPIPLSLELAAAREKLMALRCSELQTALPHVDVGELERTSLAEYPLKQSRFVRLNHVVGLSI